MRLLRRAFLLLAVLLGLAVLLVPETQAAVQRPRMLPPFQASTAQPVPPHELYLPPNAAARQPLQVVVALHGMGGSGASISAPLRAAAEHHGWVLVAPTFGYGDWRDPEQVRRDDVLFLPQLRALVESLPGRTGLQLRPRVLLYGFSRGGQTAHRFASFYPRSVAAVASFSCGTYTLPYTQVPGQGQLLAFPFGVGDIQRYTGRPFNLEALRQVSFLIGIGALDNQSGELPRQWDQYIGSNRLERARSYYQALGSLGVPAQLAVIPNGIHYESDEMRTRALEFLASVPN